LQKTVPAQVLETKEIKERKLVRKMTEIRHGKILLSSGAE